MKPYLIALTLLVSRLYAVPVDCHMILGYQGYQGMVPQCFIDSAGQATILLNGSSRLDWQNLTIAPSSPLTSLTITSGNHAVAIVDQGTLTSIHGPLSASGPLGLFTSQLQVGATGSITAPQILLSALPATNPDSWLSSGNVTLAETPSSTGVVHNQGVIRSTSGNLTVIGTTVQNEGRFGGPATMRADSGALRVVAAGSVTVTNTSVTALTQPSTSIASINNFGVLRGYSVHLRAVPRFDPAGPGLVQINITNGGVIESSAGGSGVHVNTLHPTAPVVGTTSLLAGSQLITPNSADWPTSGNVQGFLFNDGQLLDPQEDEAPTVPTEPIAIPTLGNSGSAGRLPTGSVAVTNATAPPSAVTYSSLNSLPRTGPQSKPQANPSVIATRGNPSSAKDENKKKRPTTVKGAFFQIQYRN